MGRFRRGKVNLRLFDFSRGGTTRPFTPMRLFSAVLLLLFSLLAIPPSFAQEPSPYDALRNAIEAKDFETAEAELASLQGRLDVDQIEILFLTGMLALEKNQLDRAIAAFRTILDQKPNVPRVRLELARALYIKRDDAAAKYHFELALASGLPEAVSNNVRVFLDNIRRRRDWTFNFGWGLLPDSNINSGTAQQTITLPFAPGPAVLSPEAREKSGVGLLLTADGSKSFPLANNWQMRFNASVLRRDYTDSRFDDMITRFWAGPRRFFQRGEVGLSPLFSERRFGNNFFTRSVGLRLDGSYLVSERLVVDALVEYTTNSYPEQFQSAGGTVSDQTGRNGASTFVNTNFRYLLSPSSQVWIGPDYFLDRARQEDFQSETNGLTVGYAKDWPLGISTALSARFARTEFVGTNFFLSDRPRDDRLKTYNLSITKRDWSIYEFVPTLTITHFDNASNIDLFTFTRTQVLFGFNRRL